MAGEDVRMFVKMEGGWMVRARREVKEVVNE